MNHTPASLPQKVLALDTSTDRLSLALGPAGGVPLAVYSGPGGAQASAELLPRLLGLLGELGWTLAGLDAIAFGQGPGSFTGLRTACSVVQGLAVAARPGGVPVLPIPTLLAVAQAALPQAAQAPTPERPLVAVLDARMDELYVAEAAVVQGALRLTAPAALCAPDQLSTRVGWPAQDHGPAPVLLAGNALGTYGTRLPAAWQAVPQIEAWPTAIALLVLAATAWQQGGDVAAADAQPLYVRDKVAQTTEERARLKAAAAPHTAAHSAPHSAP